MINNNLERLTASIESYISEKLLRKASIDHDHTGYVKKTDLATVAFSGFYNDLMGKPSISAEVDLDSYATINYVNTAIAEAKLNGAVDLDGYIKKNELDNYTPTSELSTVATTGSYNDLLYKPTIPSIVGLASEEFVKKSIDEARLSGSSGSVNLDDYVKKTDLASIATTGSYNDLLDKPAGILTKTEIEALIDEHLDKLIEEAFNAEY